MSEPTPTTVFGDPSIVSKRVESIRRVTLFRSSFAWNGDRTSRPKMMIPFELDLPVIARASGNSVVVEMEFGFRAVTNDQGEEVLDEKSAEIILSRPPIVDVRATFEIAYSLKNEAEVNDADLQAFGKINGRLNLNPYWREFLQSTLGRAGFQPYMIQPFNAAAEIIRLREEAREAARQLEQQSQPPLFAEESKAAPT